jgi:hypothetical protein
MNLSFLIPPKMIKHKGLDVFEFRQLQYLLEILFYCTGDFESRKVEEKLGLAWFWWFGGAMAKTGQTLPTSLSLQLCKSPNFTNSKKRYLKGDPLDLTQKALLFHEL